MSSGATERDGLANGMSTAYIHTANVPCLPSLSRATPCRGRGLIHSRLVRFRALGSGSICAKSEQCGSHGV